MNNGVKLRGGKKFVHFWIVEQINLLEDWSLTSNLIDFIENSNLAIKKIIEDFDLVSLILQFDNSVGADIAGTTGDENFHVNSFLVILNYIIPVLG